MALGHMKLVVYALWGYEGCGEGSKSSVGGGIAKELVKCLVCRCIVFRLMHRVQVSLL